MRKKIGFIYPYFLPSSDLFGRGRFWSIFMKKKSKKKQQGFFSKRFFFFLVILSAIVVISGSVFWQRFTHFRYVLETNKTEVQKLPPEIEKKLKSASPSAIRIPILMYHYVEFVRDKRDTIRQSLDIIPPVFEAQVKTLQDNGYTFITAKDLSDILDEKKEAPQKPILLTFDDGHWDLYTDVLPILQKYHIRATAYIAPGLLNGSDFLTTNQLGKVATSGAIEIGAHTVHHLWLKGRPLATVKKEVQDSKTMLEAIIKRPVVSFAYPFGAFDNQTIAAVQDAEFLTAVSTAPGIEESKTNRYFLYRLRPGGRSGRDLIYYLEGKFFRAF